MSEARPVQPIVSTNAAQAGTPQTALLERDPLLREMVWRLVAALET